MTLIVMVGPDQLGVAYTLRLIGGKSPDLRKPYTRYFRISLNVTVFTWSTNSVYIKL